MTQRQQQCWFSIKDEENVRETWLLNGNTHWMETPGLIIQSALNVLFQHHFANSFLHLYWISIEMPIWTTILTRNSLDFFFSPPSVEQQWPKTKNTFKYETICIYIVANSEIPMRIMTPNHFYEIQKRCIAYYLNFLFCNLFTSVVVAGFLV